MKAGAQPNPAHHITASAAVLGQGKAEPLPSCQAADPTHSQGSTPAQDMVCAQPGEPWAGLH